MSEQTASATVGSQSTSKVMTATVTDGQWTELKDSIGSASLGQVMPGSRVNNIAATYDTGGSMIFRVQDRNNLAVRRTGFASALATVDVDETAIPAYTVGGSDIISTYSLAVDSTSQESNGLAWFKMSKGTEAFSVLNAADETAAEATQIETSASIGVYYGSTLQGVAIQLEDGAFLTSFTVVDDNGGTILTLYGTVRDAGHYYLNLNEQGMNVPITKGMKVYFTCVSAS